MKRSKANEERVRSEGREVIDGWETTDDANEGFVSALYWVNDSDLIALYAVGHDSGIDAVGRAIDAPLWGQ